MLLHRKWPVGRTILLPRHITCGVGLWAIVLIAAGCDVTPLPERYDPPPQPDAEFKVPESFSRPFSSVAPTTSQPDSTAPTAPISPPPGGTIGAQPEEPQIADLFPFTSVVAPPDDRLLRQLPEDKPLGPPEARARMEAHLERGLELFHQQQFAEAHTALNQAVAAYPHDFRPYVFIGLSHAQQQQFSAALGAFNMAIRLNDQLGILFLHRGNIHLRLQQPSRAEADFTRCLELEGNVVPALTGRATALLNMRRFKQATRDASRAIQLSPDDADAYLLRALGCLFDGDREAGAADFRKARQLGIDPRAVEHWQKVFEPPEQ